MSRRPKRGPGGRRGGRDTPAPKSFERPPKDKMVRKRDAVRKRPETQEPDEEALDLDDDEEDFQCW